MFATLKTLFAGASARAEDRITDHYAIELIEQKIRESEIGLKAAKATLASLIQRLRSEERQVDTLVARITTMTTRAQDAIAADNTALATEAANAIAIMENELVGRNETTARLDQKVLRLRSSIEAGHRRIIDLKQGAISAKAVRYEQDVQMRLNTTLSSGNSVDEAEDLIARVLNRDDPFEQAEILKSINDDLTHAGLENRMSDAGYGPATRETGAAVLARLKANAK